MSAYAYLENVMRGLSNTLYNVSQRPNVENCNRMLDSIKRMLQDYEEATGKDLKLTDFRDRYK